MIWFCDRGPKSNNSPFENKIKLRKVVAESEKRGWGIPDLSHLKWSFRFCNSSCREPEEIWIASAVGNVFYQSATFQRSLLTFFYFFLCLVRKINVGVDGITAPHALTRGRLDFDRVERIEFVEIGWWKLVLGEANIAAAPFHPPHAFIRLYMIILNFAWLISRWLQLTMRFRFRDGKKCDSGFGMTAYSRMTGMINLFSPRVVPPGIM